MRRIFAALTIAVALTAGVGAITYGTPDGNRHPNVGLLIAEFNGAFFALCSGTLVAPDVFLTAGHCTAAIEEVGANTFVTFTSAPPFFISSFLPGTPHTHPDFGLSFPQTSDIGVVVLDAPVLTITPARIPEEGFLDDLSTRRGHHDTYFTHIGYGVQGIKPRLIDEVVRYQGVSSLINLGNAWTDGFNLQTTANPGRGRSGICFGDSGGPAFFQDTDVIAGIHSFVKNANCKGTGFSYRTDIATSLDFLADFGVTPGTSTDRQRQ
jgi:hypothetical protein